MAAGGQKVGDNGGFFDGDLLSNPDPSRVGRSPLRDTGVRVEIPFQIKDFSIRSRTDANWIYDRGGIRIKTVMQRK